MTTKNVVPDQVEQLDGIGRPSRRGFLKGLSLAVAAASTVPAVLGKGAAAAKSAAGVEGAAGVPPLQSRPAGGLDGSPGGGIFHTVDTTSGKVQGIANTG
ncbi:MAG: hypothetical protein ACREDR_24030, partial [Blastocatellia bacterium]